VSPADKVPSNPLGNVKDSEIVTVWVKSQQFAKKERAPPGEHGNTEHAVSPADKCTIKSTRECEGLGDCDGVGEKSTVCKKRACSVEIRKTSLSNADGGGDALYLDRHPVYCNVGEALSQFRLQKTTQNHMQYRYSCLTNSGSSGSVAKQSAFDMDGNVGRGMESFFLDRHEVDCGNSGILSSFRLQRNAGHGKIRYKYVCNTYSHTLTCHDKTTPWNDAGNGNVIYLDRHHLSCISGTALSRFRLQRSGNTIRYNYRCCPI